MKKGLPPVFWALGLLLLGAILIVTLGRNRDQGVPTAESADPSGTKAFVELLRTQGYDVRLDLRPDPDLMSADLVLAPFYADYNFSFGSLFAAEDSTLRDALAARLDAGKPVLGLAFTNPEAGGLKAEDIVESKATLADDSTLDLVLPKASRPRSVFGEYMNNAKVAIEVSDTGDFYTESELVALNIQGQGVYAHLSRGPMVSNRLLARADNAEAAVRIVRALAPAGGTVVITEIGIGNVRGESFVSAIGPWAVAFLWQGAFLLLVIFITHNVRFGLPLPKRLKQRGSRELVDGFAFTMARGQRTDVALSLLGAQAESRLRRVLGLSPQDDVTRDPRVPRELAHTLAIVRNEAATESPGAALATARRILRGTSEVEAAQRGTPRSA